MLKNNRSKSRGVASFLGLAVSIVAILWVIYIGNWGEIWATLQNINPSKFIWLSLLLVVHHTLRAHRWGIILGKNRGKLSDRLAALMIGNLANNIFPLRAGEIIRPAVLATEINQPFTTIFATLVVERVFDLACVLFFFGLILVWFPHIPSEAVLGAKALVVVAILAFSLIVITALSPNILFITTQKIFSKFPNLKKFEDSFNHLIAAWNSGVSAIGSLLGVLSVLLFTFFIWGMAFLYFADSLELLQITPSIVSGMTIAVLISLFVAAPSSPGFFGVYQLGVLAAFFILNLRESDGIAFSIITQAHQYLCVGVMGLLSMARLGVNFRGNKKNAN